MFAAHSSRTQAGIERIAAERRKALGLPEPKPEPKPAPQERYGPGNVLQFHGSLNTVRGRIAYIAWWHGLAYGDIIRHVVCAKEVAARFDAIANIRLFRPKWGLARLGMEFGGRDHTTILNALKRRGLK